MVNGYVGYIPETASCWRWQVVTYVFLNRDNFQPTVPTASVRRGTATLVPYRLPGMVRWLRAPYLLGTQRYFQEFSPTGENFAEPPGFHKSCIHRFRPTTTQQLGKPTLGRGYLHFKERYVLGSLGTRGVPAVMVPQDGVLREVRRN